MSLFFLKHRNFGRSLNSVNSDLRDVDTQKHPKIKINFDFGRVFYVLDLILCDIFAFRP